MNIARLTMGKISPSDQMRIQTLHELRLGYRRIVSKFSKKLSLTNCALILQPCSFEMFALNVQTSIISEVLK